MVSRLWVRAPCWRLPGDGQGYRSCWWEECPYQTSCLPPVREPVGNPEACYSSTSLLWWDCNDYQDNFRYFISMKSFISSSSFLWPLPAPDWLKIKLSGLRIWPNDWSKHSLWFIIILDDMGNKLLPVVHYNTWTSGLATDHFSTLRAGRLSAVLITEHQPELSIHVTTHWPAE